MEEAFKEVANHIALAIEAVGVLAIAIGSAVAVFEIFRVMITNAGKTEKREVWLRYAQWLVAGLTFQLAADIVRTAVTPSWDEIGKLAVIAVIRTFLTYFLDRDMEKIRELRLETKTD